MDDEEDVRKISEILNRHKLENEEDLEENYEYEEFINYADASDNEEIDTLNIEEEYILPDFNTPEILNRYSQISLKAEEKAVIDKCTDPELKNLLLLNRNKSMQLMQYYKKTKDLLMECQDNIMAMHDKIKEAQLNKKTKPANIFWKLSAPYFKDKDLYSCQPNDDVLKKRRNGELSCYILTPAKRWSKFEFGKLLSGVRLNYHINKQHDLTKKITTLNKQLALEDSSEKEKELQRLEEALNHSKEHEETYFPPRGSNEYIDWFRVSDVFIDVDKHSPLECQAFWHNYLHPDINKSPWSAEENTNLEKLAFRYNRQNWERICQELNTNRSPFTVCLHYFKHLWQKCKRSKFTTKEDEALLELVNYYKMGNYIPWVKIVQHFRDRSRPQLFHRYKYFLSRTDIKKGKFSEAEDVLLMVLVDRFGRNFKKCEEHFPKRSMVQLKARYSSNLTNFLKKGTFTVEDDEKIWQHVQEHGEKNWRVLTNTIHRCRGQLRQRYKTIAQFLQDNPNSQIKDVVRRKHHLMKAGEDNYEYLRHVADLYRDCKVIPTIKDINKVLRQRKNANKQFSSSSSEEEDKDNLNLSSDILSSANLPSADIDEMLTDYFSDGFKFSFQKNYTVSYIQEAVDGIKQILETLHVNLEVPENFDEDSRLDNVDVTLLMNLGKKMPIFKSRNRNSIVIPNTKVMRLVPPNLNTVTCLRNILLKHLTHKSQQKPECMHILENFKKQPTHKQIFWCISRNLLDLKESERAKILAERDLFFKRFLSLFKLPAIMSLEDPSKELKSTSQHWCNTKVAVDVKRTYSKVNKKSAVGGVPAKKMKIVELPANQSSMDVPVQTSGSDCTNSKAGKANSRVVEPLKLIPITDKNIINMIKLEMQKKRGNKKVILNTSVPSTSTAVVEKKVSVNVQRKAEQSSACSVFNMGKGEFMLEEREDRAANDDVEDLKKLDMFFKRHGARNNINDEDVCDSDDDMDIY